MQPAKGAMVEPGDLVAGRYRVEALVGKGGFGAVFRAVQLPMNRSVALKVVLSRIAGNAEVRARFRREAELAQRLEHPNTVRIYDFGETDSGLPFIAWEYLNGQSLEALLETSGPLDVGRAARIVAQTLKSLMEAHEKGIVHRDIKPSNIFLCDFSGERDFVKVLDFGIAKAADVKQVTRGGTMLGTPAYMSPEQVSGAPVTAASDVYALGLVLAEILSGAPVYRGGAPLAIAMAQLDDAPPPIPPEVIASALGPVVVRATQKIAERRFGSATEMLDAIERVDPAWMRGSEPRAISASSPAAPRISARGVESETAMAPTVSAPAPSALPEVPASPTEIPRGSRGRVMLFAGGAFAAIVSSFLALAVCGGKKPSTTATPRTRPSTEVHERQLKYKRLATLTALDVRARIERSGCRVGNVTHNDLLPSDTFAISCDGDGASVTYAHFTELLAIQLEPSYVNQGAGVIRDGGTLLVVQGVKNPKRILDAFRRE